MQHNSSRHFIVHVFQKLVWMEPLFRSDSCPEGVDRRTGLSESYLSPPKDGIVSLNEGLGDASEPHTHKSSLSLALQSLQKQTHKSIKDVNTSEKYNNQCLLCGFRNMDTKN